MIRLLYWLIKRRWAICRECKHYVKSDFFGESEKLDECQKYLLLDAKRDFVRGGLKKPILELCEMHNTNGCCWGFKPKGGRIEPPEPWPRR